MLRPYQNKIIEDCQAHMARGKKRIVIESPTGSGKTVLTSAMLKSARERGKTAWFNVHRVELVEQTAKTFKRMGMPFGIIASGYEPNDEPIKICSVPSLVRREIIAPNMIAWDECHHIAAPTWQRIFDSAPNAYHIGMSATPQLPSGGGLGKWFEEMVHGLTIPELTEQGYLSRYVYYAPNVPDLDDVRSVGGDYSVTEIDRIMRGKAIVGGVVEHWQRLGAGLKTVGFAPSVAASRAYVEAFQEAGVRAAHLDGDTEKTERMSTIMRFARGEIKVIFNCGLFGEGFDLAAIAEMDVNIECLIKARPTQSLILDKQMNGRALRPKQKPAVILDHAGNFTRHGLPDDVIEWGLAGKAMRPRAPGAAFAVTQCPPPCNAVFRAAVTCPYCGHTRAVQQRKLHYLTGELEQITREKQAEAKKIEEMARKAARIEVGRARTLDELVEIGMKRGYKEPYFWATNIMKGRKNNAKR